jgi:CubicO group peptidase (beta-lactamase class C family)
MFRGLSSGKYFPALVFLALLIAVESAISIAAAVSRPADIPAQPGALQSRAADDHTDSGQVDHFMIENMRRMHMPAAMVAIVRDDRILYTAGYGRRSDGSPVTPDTPMPIASLTKSFTAAAIMLLVEDGTLALDAPVRQYLPEFELADSRSVRITIRQLLNQSSGLAPRSLPPLPAVLPRSLAGQVSWLRAATLVSEPGTAFNYSNDNYNVLALVVERVSRIPFAQFLQDRLFGPLGMQNSHWYLTTGEPMPGVALGHMLVYGIPIARPMKNELMGGGGGMVSTANDLARWLVFQNTGGQTQSGQALLSPGSIAAMHASTVPGSNYGFGWKRESLPDGTININHSGKAPPYVAQQRLVTGTGYAFAIVLDAFHGFNAEAASFIMGVNELVAGRTPVIRFPYTFLGMPLGLFADTVMAVLTVLSLTIGVVGAARAGRWATRRSGRNAWLTGLRCLPYIIVALVPVMLPWLLSVMNRGRAVPWDVIFSTWPPLPIFVVVSALAGGIVVVRRSILLWRLRQSTVVA